MNITLTKNSYCTLTKCRIRSVAGVYYAKGKLDDGYNGTNIHVQFPNPFYDPVTLPVPAIELLLNNAVDPDEEFTTYALFGDIDYKLTDKFTIMAGLRANKETRKSSVTTSTARATTYGPLDATIDALLAGSFSDNQTSKRDSFVLLPKAGFNYMWSDSLATGFVVQKGYRPGGVSVNPICGIAQDYDEESTINFEASLRASINSPLAINANIFYTDWKDQ